VGQPYSAWRTLHWVPQVRGVEVPILGAGIVCC